MARTSLLRSVREWLRLARLADAEGLTATEVLARRDAARALSRRAVLKGLSAAAAVGVVVPALTACGDGAANAAADAGAGGGVSPSSGARVAIIGAGLSGLHCAYRLQQAGVRATVYDAWNRVGGRVFTARGQYPEGLVAELGGELIDTGHVTMHALADELGVELDDLFADEPAGQTRQSWYFGGRYLTEAQVVEAFRTVAGKMLSTILTVDPGDGTFNDLEFARIDAMSLRTYLDQELRAPEPINRILSVAYLSDFGLELEQQSAWNLLWLIDAETPDPFRIYGDSDERFHARSGSEVFVDKLVERLDAPALLEHRLTRIAQAADGTFVLTFDHAGASVEATFERVVLTLPFTQLRKVEGVETIVSAEKLNIIKDLGYGTNAKLMLGFGSRVWAVDHRRSGSISTDTGGQTFWATSRKQPGINGILTNFVGGERGVALGEGEPEAQAEQVLDELEPLLPGLKMRYTMGSARRMHWPSVPTHEGSYACFRPGQAAWAGLEGLAEGALHFAGEHTSVEGQGYMEGAAESGARAAAEVLDALGVARPEALTAIVTQGLHAQRRGRARAARPG